MLGERRAVVGEMDVDNPPVFCASLPAGQAHLLQVIDDDGEVVRALQMLGRKLREGHRPEVPQRLQDAELRDGQPEFVDRFEGANQYRIGGAEEFDVDIERSSLVFGSEIMCWHR